MSRLPCEERHFNRDAPVFTFVPSRQHIDALFVRRIRSTWLRQTQ